MEWWESPVRWWERAVLALYACGGLYAAAGILGAV